jgi:formyltetrahydrofolate deformylase
MSLKTFVLIFHSRDQKGIIAQISDFIFKQGGNIIAADQYSTDPSGGDFFIRIEFCTQDSDRLSLERNFRPIAEEFGAKCSFFEKNNFLRMGILVSKPDHCLLELLYLWRTGELRADIPMVISNHAPHQRVVEEHGISFFYVAANGSDRKERQILDLIKDKTDFLVLARYMLVLSGNFLNDYGKDIINIHHGLLPSFKGARPYHQAHAKGVKVIGATAHFANQELDEGPIIAQEVSQVSHRDDPAALLRKGKNIEKTALVHAVQSYLDYRVFNCGDRTVVF